MSKIIPPVHCSPQEAEEVLFHLFGPSKSITKEVNGHRIRFDFYHCEKENRIKHNVVFISQVVNVDLAVNQN